MLRAIEKRGFFQILNKLSDEEVLSLKDTVTKKQITTVGKIEAINAIITYTEKAVELLRRKKVRRDVLFQYLVDCGERAAVTAEKHQLINTILTLWGTSNDCFEIEYSASLDSASKDSTSQDSTSQESLNDGSRCVSVMSRQESLNNGSGGVSVMSRQESLNNGSGGVSVMNPNLRDVTKSYVSEQSSHEEYQSQSIQHRSILHSSTADSIASSQEIRSRNATETAVASPPIQDYKYILAKQFIEWFYKMLNSHNPSLQDIPDGEFGPQHFWQDCKLDLQISVQGETNVENYDGSMLVAQRFLALVKEERLLFNPNSTTDGIKVKSNPHGLLLVMTCGTLHRVNDCLGVFEQVFGLISDPTLDNNWKVKMSHLKIKSSQQPTMPRLESGDDKTLAIYAAR